MARSTTPERRCGATSSWSSNGVTRMPDMPVSAWRSFGSMGCMARRGLAVVGLPPGREIDPRLLLGGRIEAENRAPLHDLLGDEILKRRHLHGLSGDFVGKMGRGQ